MNFFYYKHETSSVVYYLSVVVADIRMPTIMLFSILGRLNSYDTLHFSINLESFISRS